MRVTPINGFWPAARGWGTAFASEVSRGAHPTDNDVCKLIDPFVKKGRAAYGDSSAGLASHS